MTGGVHAEELIGMTENTDPIRGERVIAAKGLDELRAAQHRRGRDLRVRQRGHRWPHHQGIHSFHRCCPRS